MKHNSLLPNLSLHLLIHLQTPSKLSYMQFKFPKTSLISYHHQNIPWSIQISHFLVLLLNIMFPLVLIQFLYLQFPLQLSQTLLILYLISSILKTNHLCLLNKLYLLKIFLIHFHQLIFIACLLELNMKYSSQKLILHLLHPLLKKM